MSILLKSARLFVRNAMIRKDMLSSKVRKRYLTTHSPILAENQQQIHFPRIEYDWSARGFDSDRFRFRLALRFAFPLPLLHLHAFHHSHSLPSFIYYFLGCWFGIGE